MEVTFTNRGSEPIALIFTALDGSAESRPVAPGAINLESFQVGGDGDYYFPSVRVVSPGRWLVEVTTDPVEPENLQASEVCSNTGAVHGVATLNGAAKSARLTGVNGAWGADSIKLKVGANPFSEPPGPFEFLAAVADGDTVALSWTESVGAHSYSVVRNGTEVISADASSLDSTEFFLQSGVHEYSLFALNEEGEKIASSPPSLVAVVS